MQKRVVIIEDEADILDSLTMLLEKNDFKVSSFLNAEEFQKKENFNDSCLYLVDWNLPGMKGTELVSKIRSKDKISPVFMMSANNASKQVVEGLSTGVDDYITKPFNYDELIQRLKNAYSKMLVLEENLINVGIKLIPEANAVIRDGNTAHLTSREYIIFSYLYGHQDAHCSREQLIEQFDKDLDMTTRNVDVHVFSLRKKVDKLNIKIETIWGKGYQLAF